MKVTVVVTGEKKLKLSDLKDAVAKLKPEKDEKFSIKLDSIKLEGRILLAFVVEKNKDKVKEAVKGVANVTDVKESGADLECVIKGPAGAKLLDLAKAVAKAVDSAEDKAADLVKDVTWTGAKKAEGTKPGAKDPNKGHS